MIPSSSPVLRHTAMDWDEVRSAFVSSSLVDSSISSLARNLEGLSWPLGEPEETPACYIDLSFDGVKERLALRGQSPSLADHLIEILRGSLAFEKTAKGRLASASRPAVSAYSLLKNMAKLGLPEDFPISFAVLTPETLMFCQLENIITLREFVLSTQRMAGNVIVGGDFRRFRDALFLLDEKEIARCLPFRRGTVGVHYVEGLAQAVGMQPNPIQLALAERAHYPLSTAERNLVAGVSRDLADQTGLLLVRRASALRGWCMEECVWLDAQVVSGADLRPQVAYLNDPLVESVVLDLIRSASPPAKIKKPRVLGAFMRIMKSIGR